MAGMPNLKSFTQAMGMQNVQVAGDRVKAGFDPPPAVTSPTPVAASVPAAAAPAPTATAAPDATDQITIAGRKRRITNATILGNGDSADTLG